jgi:pyruvate-ferredoxin/flavodoxin oxidoreductase
MPEFIFNPELGETFAEALTIKGNPLSNQDWYKKKAPVTKILFDYTVAHWAFTEARFRLHHKIVMEDKIKDLVRLEDKIKLITMNDITHRRQLNENHRSFIPDWGTYTIDYADDGSPVYHILSRQMVIFCVERRKAWRILQSRVGVINHDYIAQKEIIKQIDSGEMSIEDYFNNGRGDGLEEKEELKQENV